jgi:hypothetical protein
VDTWLSLYRHSIDNVCHYANKDEKEFLQWGLLTQPSYAVAGVSIHPPPDYNGILKRNEDALLIRVVGGGHTSTSSVPNHGVLLYFYRTPAMAEWRKLHVRLFS